MGATDGACTGFRQSPMQYLSLLHQILDRAGDLFHRHGRIDTVLVQEVDTVCTQPPERPFHRTTDMVGTTVQGGRLLFLDPETELRTDFYLVTERSECFADPLFAGLRPVHLRRIEKGHTFVVCTPDQGNHILLLILPAVIAHHRQAAQTDGRHV